MEAREVNGIVWHEAYDRAAGLVPEFVSARSYLPVVEQMHRGYAHGGGWNEFKGFKLARFDPEHPEETRIYYPGDPPYKVIAWASIRGVYIMLFDHSWCVVTTDGDKFNCARLD